jgi:exopolysaccharide production protein ExoZ
MLSNIQVLRAVAAYMVVVTHVSDLVLAYSGYDPQLLFLWAGVDIFFVISGFIMVFIVSGRPLDAPAFWGNRLVRIVPLYWLATFAIALVLLAGLRPAGHSSLHAEVIWRSLFFLPVVSPEGGLDVPLLLPGWTLNYEMLFYLIFGFALLTGTPRRAVVALSVAFVALLLLGRHLTAGSGEARAWGQFLGNTVVLEFLIGAWMALAFTRWRGAWGRTAPGLCAAAMVAGFAVLPVVQAIGFSPAYRPLAFGLPAALIVWAALELEAGGVSLASRFLLRQGDASYSIYLFHIVLVQVVVKLSLHLLPSKPAATALAIVAGVGVSALVGTLIHRHLELPLTAGLRRMTRGVPAGHAARVPPAE